MSWVTIKFSPEAKNFWRWLHTWLGVAAAGAPLAYEHLDALQGFVSARAMSYITAGLVLLMVYNTMRSKKK